MNMSSFTCFHSNETADDGAKTIAGTASVRGCVDVLPKLVAPETSRRQNCRIQDVFGV